MNLRTIPVFCSARNLSWKQALFVGFQPYCPLKAKIQCPAHPALWGAGVEYQEPQPKNHEIAANCSPPAATMLAVLVQYWGQWTKSLASRKVAPR